MNEEEIKKRERKLLELTGDICTRKLNWDRKEKYLFKEEK